jgi:hypothetical protein
MRDRAQQMRRVADMAHDPRIIELLLKMADEADADAAELEAELSPQIQQLPPQA